MRNSIVYMPFIKYGIIITGIFTVSVFLVLAYVLNLLHQGPHNKDVLWCGRAILDPLLLIINVLIPLGLICHLATLGCCYIYRRSYLLLSFTHAILFLVLLVATIIIGAHYCITKLEGTSFTSYVWWLKSMSS